ncbi:hypothetical protein ATK74_0725 [Propionicimonas paludicola]|uniref:Lipoprotein n=1 Tax=Propionicimonas paludicola TaxID=185243 RepID=A0A2A9CP68_9ACTN|nr:hypothetical protein [Propionicimonas paludicola]PFG16193.1 hypothetical protein ATK74_0725 [Propionicimonas paludicola]
MLRRVLLLCLIPLLTGCAQLTGTSEWTSITADYSGSGQSSKVTVTPTRISVKAGKVSNARDLPDGAWTGLTTAVRALAGASATKDCKDGQVIVIQAYAGEKVQQSIRATSCEAGDSMAKAQAALDTLLSYVR